MNDAKAVGMLQHGFDRGGGRPMSITYIVKTGDTLTSIAKKFNRPSWQELYNHPENADFRRRRPNPNKIFTGDAIQIPDKAGPPLPPGPQPQPPKPMPPLPPIPTREPRVVRKHVLLPEQASKTADEPGGDYFYMARFAKLVAEPDTGVVDAGSAQVDTTATISRIDYVKQSDGGSAMSKGSIEYYDFRFTFDTLAKTDVMIFLNGGMRERVSPTVANEIYEHPGHFVLRPRRPGTSGWP